MALIKVLWKEQIRLDCPMFEGDSLSGKGTCKLDDIVCLDHFCEHRVWRQAYHSVKIDKGRLKVGLAVFR